MISMIVAMDANRVIGYKNKLPWYIPDDLKNFKQLTSNNVVVMGRKTYESLPFQHGLPNRTNVVVSSQNLQGLQTLSSVSKTSLQALEQQYNKEVFIIGGASIYEQTFDIVDRIYLSLVYGCAVGDTYFPDVDWSPFKITNRVEFTQYQYKVLDRV